MLIAKSATMEQTLTKTKGPLALVTGITHSSFVVVDVREREEFHSAHLNGCLNIPLSDLRIDLFERFTSEKIFLICNSGARAKSVAKKLDLLGFNNVYTSEIHIDEIDSNLLVSTHGSSKKRVVQWSVDRQYRFALGIILTIFLGLFYYDFSWAIIVPAFLAISLWVSAIIDKYCIRVAIRLLPWNR